jgi:hypothetical protein
MSGPSFDGGPYSEYCKARFTIDGVPFEGETVLAWGWPIEEDDDRWEQTHLGDALGVVE